MSDYGKVNMTINIGGEHLKLSVDFNRQEAVRTAEKSAAELYDTWRRRWPSRTDKEVLAMVAYQFASYYRELLERYESALETANETDSFLGKVLGEGAEDDNPGEYADFAED